MSRAERLQRRRRALARAARVANPWEATRRVLDDIARAHGESASAYCVAQAAQHLLVHMGHDAADAREALRELFQPPPPPAAEAGGAE